MAAECTHISQRNWLAGQENGPKLRLFNSLTREKEEFHARSGRQVRWYSCGPTVYDASHMGHARSYITFDILRRVLQDYFGYDVNYVMNITDVDDKIILKARREYLFDQYLARVSSASGYATDVIVKDAEDAAASLADKVSKMGPGDDQDKKAMLEKNLVSLRDTLAKVKAEPANQDAVKQLLDIAKDPISVTLDKKEGSLLSDPSIFTKLTQHWEREFFKDMEDLNVLPPCMLTRVTEYVPEIVDFVTEIIKNGFAYAAPSGSVYFDVARYKKAENHSYAKLVPEAVDNAALLADGEGELATGADKRSAQDFALWKASKPGEPAWDSPWGKGRPGWHIECSAMAGDAFGDLLDIHTGGVDLKFPHHDNEIAQSEAYYNCDQWTNYFLHSGHLKIAGCKMSKSLKNFITIQQALGDYTAAQLRFAFLTHKWHDTLDYSPDTMRDALHVERVFNEFFLTVKSIVRNQEKNLFAFLADADKELYLRYLALQKDIHGALCDNIDTPAAMKLCKDFISGVNVYVREAEAAGRQPHPLVLKQIAEYFTDFLKMLGVIPSSDAVGFKLEQGGDGSDLQEQLAKYTKVFGEFYSNIAARAAELPADDERAKALRALITAAQKQ